MWRNTSFWCKNFLRTLVRDVLPQNGCGPASIVSWSLQARKTKIFKSITQRCRASVQCLGIFEGIPRQEQQSTRWMFQSFNSKIGHYSLTFKKCPSFLPLSTACKRFGQPSFHQHLLDPWDSSSTHVLQIHRWTHGNSPFQPPIRHPPGEPGEGYVFLSRTVDIPRFRNSESKGWIVWILTVYCQWFHIILCLCLAYICSCMCEENQVDASKYSTHLPHSESTNHLLWTKSSSSLASFPIIKSIPWFPKSKRQYLPWFFRHLAM